MYKRNQGILDIMKILKYVFPLLVCFGYFFKNHHKTEYVNVYNWYGMLPQNVIEKFEAETGIKVRYDIFDNNEVLEAKLFATNSGYDVVFPSSCPYVYNQIQAGVYMPLDKTLLSNIDELDPYLRSQMEKLDPDLQYSIPYIWGTTGIIYDADKIDACIEDDQIKESLDLLFDTQILKKLAPYGISFLEEGIDVFPMVSRFLKREIQSEDDLYAAYNKLLEIRPFIKRFSTDRITNDLLMGEIAIAQFWSGGAYRAILEGKKLGKNLKYIIPKEGASLWIDVMAIPKGAPNPKNAHIFINFCLRPEIAAMISNQTYDATTVAKAQQYIDPALLKVSFLYPDEATLKTLSLDVPVKNSHALDQTRTRLWTKIRRYKKEIKA
ncbi:MAG: Putrescine-binding periplasmic protein SpuD [Holosporales bacterium]